jgi:cellulose synthase/poly-beta-1,6-N-acetylglucosamine synthase-like glycosyltransferase
MRVSLIALIPAYNEEAVIAKTLESLFRAGMRPDRIIVINDASKDKTAEIAEGLGVNVINNKVNMGKAEGVTNALRIISSDLRYKDLTHICFLDADTLVDSGYFQAVRKRLSDDIRECEKSVKKGRVKKPISILCGRAKSIPHNWLTAFRAYELWLTHAIHKTAQAKFRVITVAPGCASTYSVEALKEVNWTDETVTEDMDATIQVALSGGRIAYEKNAVVYTQDPSTIRDYLGQIGKRWYPGTWQVMGKHGLIWQGLFSGLHWECRAMTLEPLAYAGILAYTLMWYPERLFWIFAVAFLTVVGLASIASLRERRFDIVKYSPIFPFILFTNLLFFVGQSWNIFGRKKSQRRKWFSPQRYAITVRSEKER